MQINIITLFPQLFEPFLQVPPLKKGTSKGLINVNLVNLRDFTADKHRTTDERPYGGGVGMVLMCEPVFKAVESLENRGRVVVLDPTGKTYNQSKAKEYASIDTLTLICGRYEGIDQRIIDYLADETISVGSFVLSGGELGALAVTESIARIIPGVIEKEDAYIKDTFWNPEYKEHPQYTKPEDFRGLKVPQVLLSGNHAEIENWRKNNTKS